MNLTARLLEDLEQFPKGSFNNLFQYSLSMIALGASKENVPWKITELLINKVTDYSKSSDSGKDTRAMSVIALASVQDQYRKAIRTKVIRKAISKLVLHLGKDMNIGADNLYTKSLIMQAFTAAGRMLPIHRRKCANLYTSLLSSKTVQGSFGGISANLHILPALVGVSYLDLKTDAECVAMEKSTEPKETVYINVCVKVEFEGISRQNPPMQNLSVANGATALDVFNVASISDPCYTVATKRSALGLSIESVCQYEVNHQKQFYWMLYIDDQMAMTGVDKYIPKTNECVTMKYQKLDM